MLEITIKGEPKELVDFFGILEDDSSARLVRHVAPLVAKLISLAPRG